MGIEETRSIADNLADLRDDVRVLRQYAKPHAPHTCEHAVELLDRLHAQIRAVDIAALRAEIQAYFPEGWMPPELVAHLDRIAALALGGTS